MLHRHAPSFPLTAILCPASHTHTTVRSLTGIPLEQLIPAPLTTITFFAFAIEIETSSSLRRAGNSAWLLEVSKCAKSRCVIGIVVAVL